MKRRMDIESQCALHDFKKQAPVFRHAWTIEHVLAANLLNESTSPFYRSVKITHPQRARVRTKSGTSVAMVAL